MRQKKSIVGILLIIIGIIVTIVGIANLCSLPGSSSISGDAIMRSIRSKALFEQQVSCYFTILVGIVLFISGLLLNKIGGRTTPTMIQCKKCGTIQDLSSNFCNKCGEKL